MTESNQYQIALGLHNDQHRFNIEYLDAQNTFSGLANLYFDAKKDFEYYFPHNNAAKIIAKYNRQVIIRTHEKKARGSKRMSRKFFEKNLRQAQGQFKRSSTLMV